MHNSQELANCIKQYAKSKKVAIGKMLSECELSINTLSSMQSGGYYPRIEALARIADYLDCSVDYLLGRSDIPSVGLTETESMLVADYRRLNPAGQEYIRQTMAMARQSYTEKKNAASDLETA